MRRPPIKINKSWVVQEIMKAGACPEFLPKMLLIVSPDEQKQHLQRIVSNDRLMLPDSDFRKKYVNYIKRTAP